MELPHPPTDWTKHPLHVAALSANAAEVERLLAGGARVNDNLVLEGTPLHVASRQGDLAVVRLLLAKGADVHVQRAGQWGEFAGTPLHDVAATRHTDIARLLLDHGADINGKEQRRRTPLHRAVSARSGTMVEFLLSKGADVNAVADWDPPCPGACYVLCSDRWMTPLHIAAREGYAEIARELVAAGAALDIKVVRADYQEFQGLTALDLARRFRKQMTEECEGLLAIL
jgi:ankyrin